MLVPFFPDIGWFYEQARMAIFSGIWPALGITTSVMIFHQGPLWTFLLIPTLMLFAWHPYGGIFAAVVIHLLTLPVVYWSARIFSNRRAARISLFLYLLSPYIFVFGLTPFDTSPIPLFTLLTILLAYRHRYFYAFLFLGFLYQVERVSIIFWPVFIYFVLKQKRMFRISDLFAFLLGSLPLVLAGPMEFFGPLLFAVYKIYALIF